MNFIIFEETTRPSNSNDESSTAFQNSYNSSPTYLRFAGITKFILFLHMIYGPFWINNGWHFVLYFLAFPVGIAIASVLGDVADQHDRMNKYKRYLKK